MRKKVHGSIQDAIAGRAVRVGRYIAETRSTVRDTAMAFRSSKSTVHKDVAERLPLINPRLAGDVREVLSANKDARALRGGMMTRLKWSFRNDPEQWPYPPEGGGPRA